MDEINRYANQTVVTLMLGNKQDLESNRKISTQQALVRLGFHCSFIEMKCLIVSSRKLQLNMDMNTWKSVHELVKT